MNYIIDSDVINFNDSFNKNLDNEIVKLISKYKHLTFDKSF